MRPFDWRPHLQPGEVLLWTGRPYPAMALIRPTAAEMLTGALGAVGVAAVLVLDRWLSDGAEGGDPASPRAILFLFLLLAALLVTGIPFRAMRRRSLDLRRTTYAVTDRRAMLASDRDRATIGQAHDLPPGAAPVLEDGSHGLHTLHFGPGSPRFLHLKDGRRVQTAIGAALAADPKRPGTP